MTANIMTGEAVLLDVRLARWPSRGLAFALDALVQLVALFLLLVLTGFALRSVDTAAFAAAMLVIIVAVFVGYPLMLETLWRGRTLGKAALGLRVVRDDGGTIRFRHALARALFAVFVDLWTSSGIVALLSSTISARGKRIGDMVAGTVVISERIPTSRTAPVAMPYPLAAWATTLDLSALRDDVVLGAHQLLSRYTTLDPAARDGLERQLVSAVAAAVTPPPPPGTPGWAYLSAVLAERTRREELRLRGYAPGAYQGYSA